MKRAVVLILLSLLFVRAEAAGNDDLNVAGLCVAAPDRDYVKEFIRFIREDLALLGINTFVLRVDWGYEY